MKLSNSTWSTLFADNEVVNYKMTVLLVDNEVISHNMLTNKSIFDLMRTNEM